MPAKERKYTAQPTGKPVSARICKSGCQLSECVLASKRADTGQNRTFIWTPFPAGFVAASTLSFYTRVFLGPLKSDVFLEFLSVPINRENVKKLAVMAVCTERPRA